MLDVRKPLGLLFMTLGALLFLYGLFISQPVEFHTPYTYFPLKLNQPVGAFMFVFGVVMWQLARYVELHTLDRELTQREKEFEKAERRRQKALAKQNAAEAGESPESAEGAKESAESVATEGSVEESDSSKPEDASNEPSA